MPPKHNSVLMDMMLDLKLRLHTKLCLLATHIAYLDQIIPCASVCKPNPMFVLLDPYMVMHMQHAHIGKSNSKHVYCYACES